MSEMDKRRAEADEYLKALANAEDSHWLACKLAELERRIVTLEGAADSATEQYSQYAALGRETAP